MTRVSSPCGSTQHLGTEKVAISGEMAKAVGPDPDQGLLEDGRSLADTFRTFDGEKTMYVLILKPMSGGHHYVVPHPETVAT